MPLPKPSTKTDWTVSNPDFATVTQEPTAQEKQDGWGIGQRPPREFMNWLFYNQDQWIKYLESVTDTFIDANLDAIVDAGGNGTHTDLQSAHDDAAVVAGSKILIISDLELDATVNITKPDIEIEMIPGKRFIKGAGAAATGFSAVIIGATADRTRIKHLAFGSATPADQFSGAGDTALTIASGAANTFLFNPQFVAGNAQDLDDSGTSTVILGPQVGLTA